MAEILEKGNKLVDQCKYCGCIFSYINCELIAGRRNYKSCYNAFFEIVDVIQDRGVLENE